MPFYVDTCVLTQLAAIFLSFRRMCSASAHTINSVKWASIRTHIQSINSKNGGSLDKQLELPSS